MMKPELEISAEHTAEEAFKEFLELFPPNVIRKYLGMIFVQFMKSPLIDELNSDERGEMAFFYLKLLELFEGNKNTNQK